MRTIDLDALGSVLGQLPEDPRVVLSGNFATPYRLLRVLDEQVATYRAFVLNAQGDWPNRQGVTLETPFVGPGFRGRPNLRYIPSRLSLVPLLFDTTCKPDAVFLHTSSVHNGTVSLGIEVNILVGAIESCRAHGGVVVAQANRHMPYTYGDAQVAVSDLDYVVEVEEPLLALVAQEPDDVSQQIGRLVADRVHDGATLQLGIGAVPDAVLRCLAQRKGMRIWSEMFSDGALALEQAGAFDESEPLTASFAFGSSELYAWMDHNRRVRMLRTEKTNDPGLIARQPMLTSVNSALQVDLFAQANAARIKNRIYSGFGGQTDFIVGALHAPGGQAFIALRSWHPRADTSTIVPLLDERVTSFQHSAIVTEQGIADIWGRSETEQAAGLIEQAAHPAVRDELWEEAGALGLV